MPTSAGEFFVNLGIKGSEKSLDALSSVKSSFKSLTSSSLEAKAAIVAAFYELGKATSASGDFGMSIENQSVLLGVAAKTIQAYDLAASDAMGTTIDFGATMGKLQNSLSSLAYDAKGNVQGLELMVDVLSKNKTIKMPDTKEINAWKDNIPQFTQRLAQMIMTMDKIQGPQQTSARNWLARTFQLSDSEIVAMAKGGLTPERIAKFMGKALSDAQIKDLARNKQNMYRAVEDMTKGFDKLMSDKTIVKGIENITSAISGLVSALEKLNGKMKIFEAMGKILAPLAYITPDSTGTSPFSRGLEESVKLDSQKQSPYVAMKKGIKDAFSGPVAANQFHVPLTLNPTGLQNYFSTVNHVSVNVKQNPGETSQTTGKNVGDGAVSVIGTKQNSAAASYFYSPVGP
jgi:hypothetical protein